MRNASKTRGTKAKKASVPRRRARQHLIGSEEAAKSADRQAERGFLFEDPYWDDAFCSYYDPTLRTCCRR
jgi:parvulin-like peptidyl-prolyl isomerase